MIDQDEEKVMRKELGKDAIRQMVKILPPEEYGEDSDCQVLQDMIMELAGLDNEDLKDL